MFKLFTFFVGVLRVVSIWIKRVVTFLNYNEPINHSMVRFFYGILNFKFPLAFLHANLKSNLQAVIV